MTARHSLLRSKSGHNALATCRPAPTWRGMLEEGDDVRRRTRKKVTRPWIGLIVSN